MRSLIIVLALIAGAYADSVWATTVVATAHVEVTELPGGTSVSARLTASVEVMQLDAEHMNKPLRIKGTLFEENSCNTVPTCCNAQAGFPCNDSANITQNGQVVSCTKTAIGDCESFWDGQADGKVDLSPAPTLITDRNIDVCESGECDPSCEECT